MISDLWFLQLFSQAKRRRRCNTGIESKSIDNGTACTVYYKYSVYAVYWNVFEFKLELHHDERQLHTGFGVFNSQHSN